MIQIKVDNNFSKEKMLELAKLYGKSAVQETAEHIFQDSQDACPVDYGDLKASGYIRETKDGFDIGYDSEYAEYVDRMPQAWLTRTGHGGKAHFLSGAAERYSGGGINVH